MYIYICMYVYVCMYKFQLANSKSLKFVYSSIIAVMFLIN